MITKKYFLPGIVVIAFFYTQQCFSVKALKKDNHKVTEVKPINDDRAINLETLAKKCNITASSAVKKYFAEMDSVDGWFDKRLIVILLLINAFQKSNDISGNLAEIGVWQGKSFIPLMHLAEKDEKAIAVDCFELFQYNRDNSGGVCIFDNFTNNIKKYCPELDRLGVIKGDSITLLPKDYSNAVGNGKAFRIFSIDGCHEGNTTFIDLKNAFECLTKGGVIVIDDYFHWCWPGVSEGVNAFMNQNVNCLKPFLIAWNKIFFTHPEYAQKYFDLITPMFAAKDSRVKKFFNVETLIYDPQP